MSLKTCLGLSCKSRKKSGRMNNVNFFKSEIVGGLSFLWETKHWKTERQIKHTDNKQTERRKQQKKEEKGQREKLNRITYIGAMYR